MLQDGATKVTADLGTAVLPRASLFGSPLGAISFFLPNCSEQRLSMEGLSNMLRGHE